MEFLAWLEETPLSLWVLESAWGFPFTLTLHSIGLAFLAGASFVVALRLYGLAPALPMSSLKGLFPLMWWAALLCLVSGLMLLIAYPAKALTNPVFYLKLGLVIAGMTLLLRTKRRYMQEGREPGKGLRYQALLQLAIWMGAIASGRFLAYTYRIMTASEALP